VQLSILINDYVVYIDSLTLIIILGYSSCRPCDRCSSPYYIVATEVRNTLYIINRFYLIIPTIKTCIPNMSIMQSSLIE